MKRRLESLWERLHWLHERVMLYLAIWTLVPVLVIATISLLFVDLRPQAPRLLTPLAYAAVLLFPTWLAGCVIVERSSAPWALRIRRGFAVAPIYLGFALFVVGGLMWWLG